ncbi:MAG: PIF1 family ATP-dependent DNA helicase [Armatimonadota bacterium]
MAKMELNAGQSHALELIESGRNIFLTGQGGVGKSALIKHVKSLWEARGKKIGITSLTGVSALALGGNTIHSWGGIGLGDLNCADLLKKVRKKPQKKNWMGTDLLVIDEISMMSPDLLLKLDFIGRALRRCEKAFGGIQLVLSGDFCQLPPVKTDVFCFECTTWTACKLEVVQLTENMRQSDPIFMKILGEVRMGILTQEGRQLLESRIGAKVGKEGIVPTKLFSHRKAADEVNEKGLAAIPRDNNVLQRFAAIDYIAAKHEIPEDIKRYYIAAIDKACQARPVLDLLVGAQVMLIHNLDPKQGLVNGSVGHVIRFEEMRPVVRFSNGIETIIQAHDWDLTVGEDIVASRRQIPLILSYAITIHRSQGSTLDYVEIDLGDDIFAAGQFYVALSRVRSLEGLSITNFSKGGLISDPKVRNFYAQLEEK